MKKLYICSFLLLQFILCVASLACAVSMNSSPNNVAQAPNNELNIINSVPASRPVAAPIIIEDVWMKTGGARMAFWATRTPQQMFTAGYPWRDPASTHILQPIRSYPPAKKKVYRKKAVSLQMQATPTISKSTITSGTALTAPTKAAVVKEDVPRKGKEETAKTFDNLYTVPK